MSITLTGSSNDILSTTIFEIEDEVSEALFETTPFLSISKKLGKIRTFDGGYKLVVPVETQEHSQLTVLSSGWEALDLSVRDATQQAEYDWMRLAMPVLISGREEAENSGERAIIDLAEVRYKNALSALMRKINQQIVGNTVTDLATLGTINGNTAGQGVSTGFLEDAAPASQGNTMGGLSHGLAVGLQNQFANAGNDFSANGIGAMYELEAKASTLMPADGDGGRFHLTLASPNGYVNYRQALFAQERYVDAKTLDASGVQSLQFSSGVIMPERAMDVAAGAGSAGSNTMAMLNLDAIYLHVHGDADFKFTGFEDISGYDGRYGRILFMGGLCASHLGSSALLVNGETF